MLSYADCAAGREKKAFVHQMKLHPDDETLKSIFQTFIFSLAFIQSWRQIEAFKAFRESHRLIFQFEPNDVKNPVAVRQNQNHFPQCLILYQPSLAVLSNSNFIIRRK